VESGLVFAGFLVFNSPLKPDAIETLKMLADSSHRVRILTILSLFCSICSLPVFQCIMITGDNPLTAVHVAQEVEIVDRECLILDIRENPKDESGAFPSLYSST
jgi:manganese-transporting P-type ATPase